MPLKAKQVASRPYPSDRRSGGYASPAKSAIAADEKFTRAGTTSFNQRSLKRLEEEILMDPKIGAVMRETGGVRKMRFAFEYRGKSGSVRVIYIDFEVYEKVYLITAYQKSEKDNLTKQERNEIRQMVTILEQQLRENEED